MTAQEYPVTTPYGQVAGYPLNNGFHTGIDYGCPMGTPVVVNGVEIGLSNNTGASTGPHLHVGKFVNGAAQNPGVGNGFSFKSAVIYDTGSDATNGNFVRITGDGALWNYLHLEKVLVTKGQVLTQGEEMTQQEAYGVVAEIFRGVTDVDPEPANADAWAKKIQANPASAAELAKTLYGEYKGDPQFRYKGRHYDSDMATKYEQGVADGGGKATELKPGTYKVS